VARGISLDRATREKLAPLARVVIEHFNSSDWTRLGAITGTLEMIRSHPRLLRSLSWGDPDYEEHVNVTLYEIASAEVGNLEQIEEFVQACYGGVGENISTSPSKARVITFSPAVFEVPAGGVEPDLIAVMMPFAAEFEGAFAAIRKACDRNGLRCLRARDIWENSAVVQDIFSLIFKAQVVVCDFTGRNPNVFYEAGIAHALGKSVVPLTQNPVDIPFDIGHHRYLRYLANKEGLADLAASLADRLARLAEPWTV
jgi:hypothetical protein